MECATTPLAPAPPAVMGLGGINKGGDRVTLSPALISDSPARTVTLFSSVGIDDGGGGRGDTVALALLVLLEQLSPING